MIRVLVTRPQPDAGDTAARLAAIGCTPVILPLMQQEPLTVLLPDPEALGGLVLTSVNALRALADRQALAPYRHLPVYAVGDKTATAARQAGFATVLSAQGNANDLAALIAAEHPHRPLFYPCAEDTAHNLPEALAPAGVTVLSAPIYRMTAVTALPAGIVTQLQQHQFAAALFYSRRTAETFCDLTRDKLTAAQRQALTALCLSENVAAPLIAAGFARIGLADFPSEEAMMATALSFVRQQIKA